MFVAACRYAAWWRRVMTQRLSLWFSVEDVLLQNITFIAHVEEPEPTVTGVSYTCNQCEMKTAWRSAIVRHIKEKHVIVSLLTTTTLNELWARLNSTAVGLYYLVKQWTTTNTEYLNLLWVWIRVADWSTIMRCPPSRSYCAVSLILFFLFIHVTHWGRFSFTVIIIGHWSTQTAGGRALHCVSLTIGKWHSEYVY